MHVVWRSDSGQVIHELRDATSTPWVLDEHPGAATAEVRVLLSTDDGVERWSAWSRPTPTRISKRELSALAVAGPPGASAECGVEYFRTSFQLRAVPTRAELSFTIWGIGTVRVNGVEADDEVLFPGWTDYRFRHRVASVDVAHLLQVGENVVSVEVADGWFRGRLGAVGDSAVYGEERRVLAQLDLPGAPSILTDGAWRWFGAAHRRASLYDGSAIELAGEPFGWMGAGFDDTGWPRAVPTEYNDSVLVPREGPGVRIVARGPAAQASAGSNVYDCGANRSGVVRVTGQGRRGDRIVVEHAEILTPHGELNTASNRGAECRDYYILAADGTFDLQPSHTYRGFRFVRVSGALARSVEWIEYSSANDAAPTFSSSNAAFRAMHEVSVRTVRSNLVSIPTDCPQRDERLGWTGDAQLVVATAQRLFPLRTFWSSWMRDLISSTAHAGAVPPLVPDIVRGRGLPIGAGVEVDMYDRAGWADALVEIPYQLLAGDGRPQTAH